MNPSLPIRLRRMTPADLPQVEALDRLCFRTPWPPGSFAYELRPDAASICLVAECADVDGQNRIVGNVVIWLAADEAQVATLAVAPEQRGKGAARALLAAGLLLAWKLGARKSVLEVRVSNEAALRLYYGLGYEAVSLRPGYYEDTHEDALLLTLAEIHPEALQKLLKPAESGF
ncbi:MAG: ribosomal protein S18-alanine N-acetyltransferase [Anaerolineaceae bacterium]